MFVNRIASSVFAVYLIHVNPLVFTHFTKMMKNFYDSNSGLEYIAICFLVSSTLLVVGVCIDKIRVICQGAFETIINHKKTKI